MRGGRREWGTLRAPPLVVEQFESINLFSSLAIEWASTRWLSAITARPHHDTFFADWCGPDFQDVALPLGFVVGVNWAGANWPEHLARAPVVARAVNETELTQHQVRVAL